jgi:hypothetical protein
MDLEHVEKLTEAIDMAKSNKRRIEKLECESAVLHQLATSVAVMAEQMKGLNQNVTTLTGDLEKIKEKPAKRFDLIITAAITAIVSAIVGVVIGLIF